MKKMTAEDLGDPRLYEDEAIREQAARLQIHVSNLKRRIKHTEISRRTYLRLAGLEGAIRNLMYIAEKDENSVEDDPL